MPKLPWPKLHLRGVGRSSREKGSAGRRGSKCVVRMSRARWTGATLKDRYAWGEDTRRGRRRCKWW